MSTQHASERPGSPTSPQPDHQRTVALQQANKVRLYRAQLKRDLKAQRTTVADVVLDPPDLTATMPILELLVAAPRIGRVRAQQALSNVGVSLTRPLGSLTPRQRASLASALANGAGR